MSDNIIETKLISKYLLNNSAKTAEAAKTSNNNKSTNSNKTQTAGLADVLELSSMDTNPFVYTNYNAKGQYEIMPTLADYLNDEENDSRSNLFGDDGSSQTSLVDFLNDSSSQSGADSYSSVFDALADANRTRNDLIIEQALNKIQGVNK
ncbi:hypothetical protein [Syntrophomonas palmitatica]|uniref:hypothetical protein n=1 Tax=Syntrophomonas palmitatica TaxID=402877 RepID=UPI0006D26193|nr:hypothetical protein [Syntrophomonas palmitatica]